MKWKKIECSDGIYHVCECCENKADIETTYDYFGYARYSEKFTKFCPNCGTKLEEVEN